MTRCKADMDTIVLNLSYETQSPVTLIKVLRLGFYGLVWDFCPPSNGVNVLPLFYQFITAWLPSWADQTRVLRKLHTTFHMELFLVDNQ